MNRLDLVQRLALECGAAAPGTTVAVTGEAARLVAWIDSAWNDIQTKHRDWGWMRTSTSWVTGDGQHNYTTAQCGIADGTFGMWAIDSVRCYPTAVGNQAEMFVSWMRYDAWRDTYLFGGGRATRTRPQEFAVGPDKSINVGPVPSTGYTLTADYFTAPLAMAADGDTPALPTQFQMAIVYRAMMSYGGYESAPEVYQRGETEFKRLMQRMEQDRLPMVALAGPLA